MRNCKLSSHEVYSTAREMASKVENPSASKQPRLPLSLKRNSSSKKPTSSLRFALASDADAFLGPEEMLKSGLEFVMQLTHQMLSQRSC